MRNNRGQGSKNGHSELDIFKGRWAVRWRQGLEGQSDTRCGDMWPVYKWLASLLEGEYRRWQTMGDGSNEREERERMISGPAPEGSLHLLGGQNLDHPQSSFFYENGENAALNESGRGWGVVRDDDGACLRMLHAARRARPWGKQSRVLKWNEERHEVGHEERHEEGTSSSDVKGVGIGSQASGVNSRGGGMLVMSSFIEGVEVEQETIAEFLTCAWLPAAKISRLLQNSCACVERVLMRSDSEATMAKVNTKLKRARPEQDSGSGGENDVSSGASRGGEIEPTSMSRVASSGLGKGGVMGKLGECLSSPGGIRMVKSISNGRGMLATGVRLGPDEVKQTGMTLSGLGEGGAMRPFGESLGSPGGVRTVESIGEGGRSGELSGTVSELTIVGSGVDSSSRSPSTRDGDSVADGKSLDAGRMGNAEGNTAGRSG
ncbi:hypothetical protein EDB89DRAFT_1906371 [Lactarius sanguifluus]|nr:hypothetical protein EDB89DRAFT_1906371 [Lactarius sanguifluus]